MLNSIVNDSHEKPQKLLLSHGGSRPHFTHCSSIGPTHSPPQIAVRSLHAFTSRTATPQISYSLQWDVPPCQPPICRNCGAISTPIHAARPWTHPTDHPKRHRNLLSPFSITYIDRHRRTYTDTDRHTENYEKRPVRIGRFCRDDTAI